MYDHFGVVKGAGSARLALQFQFILLPLNP